MKPETLTILQSPKTAEHLKFAAGNNPAFLQSQTSKEKFPVRDGIADFISSDPVTGLNQKYQKLYNRLAPLYDLSTAIYASLKSKGDRARITEYLQELEIKDGDRVLETSIGTGRNIHFLPRSASYFGIDISWGMLKQCQRKVRQHNWDVELFLCAAESLCFQDNAFDVVFHVGGINYFNDRSASIREMIRVAKPGSKLIIVDETEELAKKYENTPGAGEFYKNRPEKISSPIDLLPADLQDVCLKPVANGELYCLSFRKPAK
ncbi:MAG: class I SAM-dependent methyltransferase [Anaerolineaceae bacterium]|nr:class I SAM-dependent methyltransferase [Anaerolineaceae bacterium]